MNIPVSKSYQTTFSQPSPAAELNQQIRYSITTELHQPLSVIKEMTILIGEVIISCQSNQVVTTALSYSIYLISRLTGK